MLLRLETKNGKIRIYDLSTMSESSAVESFVDEMGEGFSSSSSYNFDCCSGGELIEWVVKG